MYQCPRCHYETFHKGNLKNHFFKSNPCLPTHDKISIQKLREKVSVRNSFKMNKNESNDFNNSIKNNQIESIKSDTEESNNNLNNNDNNNNDNKKKDYRCKFCNKNYSTNSHMNRHMKTCKIKIEIEQKEKEEKEKNDENTKLKYHIECLYKDIYNLKKQTLSIDEHYKNEIDKLKNQNFKLKRNNLKLENKIFELENPEEDIENKSKYVNKQLSSHKKKSIPLTLRNKIWLNKYGESFNGDCYCCSKEINIFNFHCGHIISRKDNGPINEDNLRPICQTCNSSMGSQNLEEFKNTFFT